MWLGPPSMTSLWTSGFWKTRGLILKPPWPGGENKGGLGPREVFWYMGLGWPKVGACGYPTLSTTQTLCFFPEGWQTWPSKTL